MSLCAEQGYSASTGSPGEPGRAPVPEASHAEALPAVPGSGAGMMVVKRCGEAQDWWVCMALEGCRWHNALGTMAGSGTGAWTCWGAWDRSANSWSRGRQPRHARTRVLCWERAVKEAVSGALHGNHSQFCWFRVVISTLHGQNPDLFRFST